MLAYACKIISSHSESSAMNGRQLRTALRGAHVVIGLVAAFLIYAPLASAETVRTFLAVGIIPALALTGVAMWQQAKLRKLFQRSGGRGAAGPRTPTVSAAKGSAGRAPDNARATRG